MTVLISLIQPSGEVAGDHFGETDSRFTYVLLNSLSLLGRLDALDDTGLYGGKAREMVVENLRGCMNFDSGFGSTPGGESHGGQSGSCFMLSFCHITLLFPFSFLVSETGPHPLHLSRRNAGTTSYPNDHPIALHITPATKSKIQLTKVWVCLAALSLLNRLDIIDIPTLAGWLSERQLPSGGLNGRPEKLEDVCYSWWDLASLSILGKLNWINRDKLIGFILESQVSCIC